MPLIQNLLSLDEEFANCSVPPIIINDLASKSEDDRQYFTDLIRETYSSDMVSVLPHCQCGELKGEHVIGQLCEKCETPVKQCIEDNVSPSLWFRRPAGVEKMINPIIFTMLSARFSPSKFRVIQWLTDRSYSPAGKMPEVVRRMIDDKIPRGYNNFVQNFDEIMAYLFAQKEFRLKKGVLNYILDMLGLTHPSKDPLQQLLLDRRDALFSDFIPLPNRSLLVLEKSALGHFVDASTVAIQDTLNTMLSIDRDYYDKSITAIENRTGKIFAMLSDYYVNLFCKNLSPKPGLFRKHNYGSRLNHAFRAVITSHEDIEDHDVVYIPWCVGVTVWRLHIFNRLMSPTHKYGGMMHNEAVDLLMSHVYKYHPILDAIMKDFISSCGHKGVPVLQQRNSGVI